MIQEAIVNGGMLLLFFGVLGWAVKANKADHKDIYDKLHADHSSLSGILHDIYEKLGGKSDK